MDFDVSDEHRFPVTDILALNLYVISVTKDGTLIMTDRVLVDVL